MWRSSLSALTLIIAVAATTQADVYKYVDAQGRVQYTDKPQTLPAQRLNIQSQKTDTVALEERTEAERKRQQATAQARQQAAAQKNDQQQAAEVSAKDKAEHCAKARQRYDNYTNSQRLYEQLPNGERRYLSDAELDAARASAKVSMDELCKDL